jgi:hypothetical protein
MPVKRNASHPAHRRHKEASIAFGVHHTRHNIDVAALHASLQGCHHPTASVPELYAELGRSSLAFATLVAKLSEPMDDAKAASLQQSMLTAAFDMYESALAHLQPQSLPNGGYKHTVCDILFRKLPYFQFAREAGTALNFPDNATLPPEGEAPMTIKAAFPHFISPSEQKSIAEASSSLVKQTTIGLRELEQDHDSRLEELKHIVGRRDVRDAARRVDNLLRAARAGLVAFVSGTHFTGAATFLDASSCSSDANEKQAIDSEDRGLESSGAQPRPDPSALGQHASPDTIVLEAAARSFRRAGVTAVPHQRAQQPEPQPVVGENAGKADLSNGDVITASKQTSGTTEKDAPCAAAARGGTEALLKLLDEAAVFLQVDLLDRLEAEHRRSEACEPP